MSKKEMSEKELSEEEEINVAYKKLVDEYNEKEKKMTLSSTRTKFAMGVHEKIKKQQVEEILKKAGNIVKEINDSSGDNTELYEKFDDLTILPAIFKFSSTWFFFIFSLTPI
jgi:hypothetical protein